VKSVSTVGALASALLLSACVTPTTERPTVTAAETSSEAQRQAAMAMQMRQDEKARVAAVAERLFTANVDLCPQVRRSLGMRAEVLEGFPTSFRPAAKTLGYDARPRVA